MHPADCPKWEYNAHPNLVSIGLHISELLLELSNQSIDGIAAAKDSRAVHGRIFRDVVPAGHPYFAGNYRGSHFRCLRYYSVGVPGDGRVGSPPDCVDLGALVIAAELDKGITALENRIDLTELDRLRLLIKVAASVFVLFLTIHPYANGNGHVGRFIVWSVLGRFGYWPRSWTIEPRPPDPPYSINIRLHRDGNSDPLEQDI